LPKASLREKGSISIKACLPAGLLFPASSSQPCKMAAAPAATKNYLAFFKFSPYNAESFARLFAMPFSLLHLYASKKNPVKFTSEKIYTPAEPMNLLTPSLSFEKTRF